MVQIRNEISDVAQQQVTKTHSSNVAPQQMSYGPRERGEKATMGGCTVAFKRGHSSAKAPV